jgi:hypothetical protein
VSSPATQVKGRARKARTAARRGAKRAGSTAKRTARNSGREIKHATANPWLVRLTRLGYLVRGVLYAVIGGIALSLALGAPGRTPDQRGEIVVLSTNPVAPIALLVLILGLSAYSIWGFVRAIYDPLGRGDGPNGLAARLGFAWSGLNYGALVVLATTFLTGAARQPNGDSIQDVVGTGLSRPWGWIVVIVAGGIGTIGGLAQFAEAIKATFRSDLKRNQMSKPARASADSLGRLGMFSRGVIFTMLGLFVLQAGLERDATKAHGMGVAFDTIAGQPLGHIALAIIASGFLALGLHSAANARWVRLPRRHK